MKDMCDLVFDLRRRELGGERTIQVRNFSAPLLRRLDTKFNGIINDTDELSAAINRKDWRDIERVVEALISKLLDNLNPDLLARVTPSKKLEREVFVQYGGMRQLIRILEPPLCRPDARAMPATQINYRVELWNAILVLLREVCFTVPGLAETVFTTQHIRFIFTLLAHDVVFENAMNLLEEILAVRYETFSLHSVPDLYSLIHKFSSRQLIHFCRVLALLLFEPEDRQIMESANALRSIELLRVRRDRMTKVASSIIDRNQCLIIEMPDMIPRLVGLLKIINFGPTLTNILQRNVTTFGSPISAEFFSFVLSASNIHHANEWNYYAKLESIARSGGFSPMNLPPGADSTGADEGSMLSMLNVMRLSAQHGSTNPTHSPTDAARELLCQAVILFPHQVELLFVLCTLLSGRRKLHMQQRLLDCDLGKVLLDMYPRLSWDDPPFQGENPLEHIHGPNCECNPENALRVQYLRLVHNFFDKDFCNNANKRSMLTPYEANVIFGSNDSNNYYIPNEQKGIIGKIIFTLQKEPLDSIYVFWLCSCIESYLRSSDPRLQLYLARSGLLQYIVLNIVDNAPKLSQNLQTFFDLLGELIKYNVEVISMIEELLSNAQFTEFTRIIMDNLVDSNVFLRSMYLTYYRVEYERRGQLLPANENPSYLAESWVQFAPSMISTTALGRLDLKTNTKIASHKASPSADTSKWTLRESVRGAYHGLRTLLFSRSNGKSDAIPAPDVHCGVSDEMKMDQPGLALFAGVDVASSVSVIETFPRLSRFLGSQRVFILGKLMSNVDLASINHENICCVNTSLLLLLYAYHRL